MEKVRLFKPHAGQKQLRDSKARFKIAMNGRRWGKTMYAVAECIKDAHNKGHRIWWVTPTFSILQPAWRMATGVRQQLPYTWQNKTERTIGFPSGGTLTFKSADKEGSLRSEGLDGLVIDEGAFIRENAWTQELRPALVDKQGWAILISTPNGDNWFSQLHGEASGLEGWEAFQFPSSDNPHLPAEEIEDAKSRMPEEVFKQEFMAIPMSGAGSVFTNIERNVSVDPDTFSGEYNSESPHWQHMLAMTIDWAKHKDFTVVDVGCLDCKVELEMARFNKIDYTFQRDRIKELYDKWDPELVIAELNAMGDVNSELLWEDDIPVTGWTMTAHNKPGLIRSLATALQREEWRFLDIPEATKELYAFQQRTNPSTGRSTYSAPKGGHDDSVITRALLVYAEANMGHVPLLVT